MFNLVLHAEKKLENISCGIRFMLTLEQNLHYLTSTGR